MIYCSRRNQNFQVGALILSKNLKISSTNSKILIWSQAELDVRTLRKPYHGTVNNGFIFYSAHPNNGFLYPLKEVFELFQEIWLDGRRMLSFKRKSKKLVPDRLKSKIWSHQTSVGRGRQRLKIRISQLVIGRESTWHIFSDVITR